MAHQSNKVTASVTSYSPQQPDIKDPPDLAPSDTQPQGVDEEPQSLEEALVG